MCSAQSDVRFVPIADIGNLFDHLRGAGKYCRRNGEALCLRGLEVDHQFILGRRLHRKIARLLTFKDAIDIAGRAPVLVDKIRPIGDQPALDSVEAGGVNCRQFVPGRQRGDQVPMN